MYTERFKSIKNFIESYMPERFDSWKKLSSKEVDDIESIYRKKSVEDFKNAYKLLFTPPDKNSKEYDELVSYFREDISLLELIQNNGECAQDIYMCLEIDNEKTCENSLRLDELKRIQDETVRNYAYTIKDDSNISNFFLHERFKKIKETYTPVEVKQSKKESVYLRYIKTSGPCYPNYGPAVNGYTQEDSISHTTDLYSKFNERITFKSEDFPYLPEFIRQRNKNLMHDLALLRCLNRKATHLYADQIPSMLNNMYLCSSSINEIENYYCERTRFVIIKNNYSTYEEKAYSSSEDTRPENLVAWIGDGVEVTLVSYCSFFQTKISHIIPVDGFEEKLNEFDEMLKNIAKR